MIEFHKVEASNFFSLGEAVTLNITPGVGLVYGKNLDTSTADHNVSNGAGKTALFNAIFQGLFNKNIKDNKGTVTTVNNLYTGKPYVIKVEFSVGEDRYFVENNRVHNKISIIKNGEDITPKGIANQLTLIKNILGFDANTFMSLTFLNQASLDNIVDISSKENVVYQFFNIERLKTLEKGIKQRVKDLKEEAFVLNTKKEGILKSLSVLENRPTIDEEELYESKAEIQEALLQLEDSKLAKSIESLKGIVQSKDRACYEKEQQGKAVKTELNTYKKLVEDLSDGTCPVCGSAVTEKVNSLKEPIKDLEEKLKALSKEYKELKADLAEAQSKLSGAETAYEERRRGLLNKLNAINSKLQAYEASKKAYEKIEQDAVVYKEELTEIDKSLDYINDVLAYLKQALVVIKSGVIVEEYLTKYSTILEGNIKELLKSSSFSFSVNVEVKKGKLSYKIIDGGKAKTFTQLSSGERTRVSLTILLATLKTIEQLTGTSINFLVLDELLGVLDEDGVSFLKGVINGMRKNKAVFIISHHDEIEKVFGDYAIYVTKKNKITTVEVTDV